MQYVVWFLVATVALGCYANRRIDLNDVEAGQLTNTQYPQVKLAWQRFAAAHAMRGIDRQENSRRAREGLARHIRELAQHILSAPENDASQQTITALVQLGEYADARRRLEQSGSTEPWRYEIETVIAQREQRWADVERLVQAQIKLQPNADHGPLYDALVTAYVGQGRWMDAENLLQRLVAESDSDAARAYWHFLLAQHYKEAGRPQLARDHAAQAVAMAPRRTDGELELVDSATALIGRLDMETPACLFASRNSESLRK